MTERRILVIEESAIVPREVYEKLLTRSREDIVLPVIAPNPYGSAILAAQNLAAAFKSFGISADQFLINHKRFFNPLREYKGSRRSGSPTPRRRRGSKTRAKMNWR